MIEKGISTLDWPGNSPDLNPIENLWHIMALKINNKMPTSVKMLNEVLEEVWYKEISAEHLHNLVDSMPKRINDVIKNKGGATKY